MYIVYSGIPIKNFQTCSCPFKNEVCNSFYKNSSIWSFQIQLLSLSSKFMNSCTYDMTSTFYLKLLSSQKRGLKSQNSTMTERFYLWHVQTSEKKFFTGSVNRTKINIRKVLNSQIKVIWKILYMIIKQIYKINKI